MEKICRGSSSAGIARWLTGALVVGLGGLAVALSATSAVAQPSAAFTIRSSLDGKTVLPHRIRWLAYPSAPVHFPGVEFLIDGKLVFDNRLEPYAFGADGRDEATGTVKTGYLVTSWLFTGKAHVHRPREAGPGPHRGDENSGRPRATGTRAAGDARGNVDTHPPERGAARQGRALPRHRSGGCVPDHRRPALHPHDRAEAGGNVKNEYVATGTTIRIGGPCGPVTRLRAARAIRGAPRRPIRGP